MEIEKNISLAQYTTFKIGGPAKEFVVIRSTKELIRALQYAKRENLKYYILGGGSNVFFDDRGFDGLVIRLVGRGEVVFLENDNVKVWAGERLGKTINLARERNLSGMENLSGIPGTAGGAIRGNAGAFGITMQDLVMSVEVLDKNSMQIETINTSECQFGYRESLFKYDKSKVILGAILQLKKGENRDIAEKMKAIIQKRQLKQPMGWVGCAGSFFENPIVNDSGLIARFKKDTGAEIRDGKLPAGWLIAEAGLKGKRIGDIEVSGKHANFVINTGRATAQNLIMMASFIKQQVRDELGVQLKEEVEFVGY